MAKKVKCEHEDQGETAPLWIISFADLVTLMLSFFVILSSGNTGGNDIKQNPQFAELVAALKAAFGNTTTPLDASLDPATEFDKLVRQLLALAKKSVSNKPGDTSDEGIAGRHFRVRKLSDGMEITMGGPVYFEPFSATLTESGKKDLDQILQIVKGYRNIIEVRGHAGEEPLPADWTYEDAMKLSYARAEHVSNELLKQGIDPRAIRIIAAGSSEPVAKGVYDPQKRGLNRRVEIIVRESLIDDYIGRVPTERVSTSAPDD